jgi:hypothetical protein
MEMVPAVVGSNETRKAKGWSQTTPLHLPKPDHPLGLLNTQLQTLIETEMGGTATNVAAAANANLTPVNGETASEVESLPVVLAVTGNGLWTDARAVAHMTATTENVSNPFIYSMILPPWSPEVIGL